MSYSVINIWWLKPVIFAGASAFFLVFLWLLYKALKFRKTKIKLYNFKCGHRSVLVKEVEAHGEKQTARTDTQHLEYCPECLARMAIKCAWCGNVIWPGEPITLYSPSKKDFQVPDGAVVYSKEPLLLVGCLGWNCAETGGDRSGFWVPPGKVHRVASMFEMLMGQGSPEILICNNLSDPKNIVPTDDVIPTVITQREV